MSTRTPIGHDLLEQLASLDAVDGLAKPLAKAARSIKAPAQVNEALSGTWLGHPVHPLLIVLPMGSWISAVVLDWLGGKDAETAADVLLGAGLVTAVPTVATGYADWADTEPASDTVRRLGIVHAALNATAATLFGASLAARAGGARGRVERVDQRHAGGHREADPEPAPDHGARGQEGHRPDLGGDREAEPEADRQRRHGSRLGTRCHVSR